MNVHRPSASAPPRRSSAAARRPWRVAVVTVVAAVVGALLALGFAPPGRLGEPRVGDRALLADVERLAGAGHGYASLSVARVAGGAVSFAGLGDAGAGAPGPDTPYELGSVTKTWTGMLVADEIERGRMRLDAPVSTYLPELAGTPAGDSTVRQLATHTSGLPALPPQAVPGALAGSMLGRDGYAAWDTARVLRAARTTDVGPRDVYAYSNLGVALLGHGAARAAGASSWQALVTERLLRPLGMHSTEFVAGGGAEPEDLARPHRINGWPVTTWTSEGFAPAGAATRTTTRDLAAFATAILQERAPGMAALTPLTGARGDNRIGLTWQVSPRGSATTTWHNGGVAGGFTTLALDREAGRAAIVLTNSGRSVDEPAVHLLTAAPGSLPAPPVALGLVALAVAVTLLLGLLRHLRRPRARVPVAAAVLDGISAAFIAAAFGPWHVVPFWVFGALAGLALVGVVAASRRLPGLPTWPAGRRIRPAIGLAVSVLVSLAAAAGALGPLVA